MLVPGDGCEQLVVADAQELRSLAKAARSARSDVDHALSRVAGIIGPLDRRGWNASAADGLWSRTRSGLMNLEANLEQRAANLDMRADLVDRFETRQQPVLPLAGELNPADPGLVGDFGPTVVNGVLAPGAISTSPYVDGAGGLVQPASAVGPAARTNMHQGIDPVVLPIGLGVGAVPSGVSGMGVVDRGPGVIADPDHVPGPTVTDEAVDWVGPPLELPPANQGEIAAPGPLVTPEPDLGPGVTDGHDELAANHARCVRVRRCWPARPTASEATHLRRQSKARQ